jgi:hypothetical protein
LIISLYDISGFEFFSIIITSIGLHKKNITILKIIIIPLAILAVIYSISFILFLQSYSPYLVSNEKEITSSDYFILIKSIIQLILHVTLTAKLYMLLHDPIAFIDFNNNYTEESTNNNQDRDNYSLPSYSPPNPLPPYSPPTTNINSVYVQSPVIQVNGNSFTQYPQSTLTPYPPQVDDEASIVIIPTRIGSYPPLSQNTIMTNNNSNNILPDHSISVINPNSLSNITTTTNNANLEVPSNTNSNESTTENIPTQNSQEYSNHDISFNVQYTSTSNLLNTSSDNDINTTTSVDIVNVRIEEANHNESNNNTQNNDDIDTNRSPPPPYSLY